MTLLITVAKKHLSNVAFINVVSKVLISIAVVSYRMMKKYVKGFYKKVFWLKINKVSSSGMMVECFPYFPKVKGSNPAASGGLQFDSDHRSQNFIIF
jgi:hypothetical protein